MKILITEIKDIDNASGVQITAFVYWRGLPPPDYQNNETDEQYAARVKPIAEDIAGYSNLHIGRAELLQNAQTISIPKVSEYE
jgi:hypothetical protein